MIRTRCWGESIMNLNYKFLVVDETGAGINRGRGCLGGFKRATMLQTEAFFPSKSDVHSAF